MRKLLLVALLCAGSAPAGLSAQAQAPTTLLERRANLEVGAVPLVEALRALQARSGVPISFSTESIPAGRATRCACLDVTVAQALDSLLRGTELTYQERRSQILVVPDRVGPEAGATGALVGRIVEEESGQPIRSARVSLRSGSAATLTDADGRFLLLGLEPDRYRVDVDALGFRGLAGVVADVGAHEPATLTLELAPNPLALAELIVAPGTFGMLDHAALLPQTLTRSEMDALPQLGEDVFRTMERLPGVATDDISAKMSVRGGNEDELLIMLDGTELFEPYHLRDLDAIVGVVDVATLRGVNLVAGGLPTEHGDRMSGLLDMRTQQPIGSGARHSIGLSASNVTLRTQGTFADGRGGWLVSGRRGFLDLLLAMASATNGDDGNDELSPRYFDVMAKAELLAGSAHRVSAHLLYAGDDLSIAAFDSPSDRAELGSDWTNLNVWTGWDWDVSPTVDVSTVASAADLHRRRVGDYISPGSSQVADYADVNDRADATFQTVRQDWRAALGDRLVLKAGGQLRRARASYRYQNVIGQELLDAGGQLAVDFDTTDVRLEPASTESTAYLATRVQTWDRLTLEVGARYDHRTLTNDSDLSPRVQAAWDIGPATTLRSSWGAQRQSHGVEELSVADGDTTFFSSELARQVAVGVQHRLGDGHEVRVEAYHRAVSDPRPRYLNVIREIIPFPEVGNDRVRFLPDEGRARGLEVMVSGPLGGGSSWSGTYVLAAAEDRLGEEWVPRTLDQRQTLGLRWHHAPNERWQLSAGFQYHTGWPITPMEFQVDTLSMAGPDDRDLLIRERPGAVNSERLPSYHRLDFRATRTFDVGRGRLRVFLDVFNLYNRKNLRSYDYRVDLPSGRVVRNPGESLLPLLPSFGFTWEF